METTKEFIESQRELEPDFVKSLNKLFTKKINKKESMKTLENYLKNTGKHLFQFKGEKEEDTKYMKVLVDDKTFTVLKFDYERNIKSVKTYNIDDYKTISSKGKEYIDTYFKNGFLFYRGSSYNAYKISTIKHFKAFNTIIEEYKNKKQTNEN